MPPGVLARFYRPKEVGVLNSFLPGGGEFAHQKNCPGGMVRLGIDWYIRHFKKNCPNISDSKLPSPGKDKQPKTRPPSYKNV